MTLQRQHLIFVAALVAVLGAFVAILATIQHRDYELRGYRDATTTVQLPYRVPRLGVNVELTQYSASDLSYHFNLMDELNMTWVRQFVYWDEIEPLPRQYQWSQWDHISQQIQAFPELQLVAVFVNSPAWARTNTNRTTPPDNPDSLSSFVRQFAERYGHVIDYYQIWDEPNLKSGWGGIEPNVVDYAALLSASYQVIHAVDPTATVLAAALAPTVETGPDNLSDYLYLENLYRLGIADFADGIASKPYGFDTSHDDRSVEHDHLNFSRIIALREIMERYDAGKMSLWASNWGWNAVGTDWQGSSSIWGNVTQEQQIQYSTGAIARAEREWPWLGGMILHHWQPDAPSDDPQWGFSLLNPDGTPKDLYYALVKRPQHTAAYNGLYAAKNPFASYSGIWTVSDFGADIGWVDDSALTFNFVGRDLALFLRQGNYTAHFYPVIDGKPPNALPHDVNGNAYLLLNSGDLQQHETLTPVATDLDYKSPHTLHIIADELIPDEMANRWPLIGFAVSSGDLAAPYNRQIQAGVFTLVFALISVFVTGLGIQWTTLFSPLNRLLNGMNHLTATVYGAIASLALMLSMYFTWSDGLPTIFRRESVQLVLSIITSGVIYINEPGIILIAVIALFLFLIIYNHLEIGLYLTVFWSPFFLYPVELYHFAFPMVEVVLIITFVAWMLKLPEFISSTNLRLHPTDILMGSWVILGLASLMWTERIDVALTELRSLIIQPALFYIMVRTVIRDRNSIIRLVDALLIAAVIVSVVGLVTWINGTGIITAEGGTSRLVSVYGSPNNVALLLGRAFPFILALSFIKTHPIRQMGAVIACIILSVTLLLTQSAGAIFLGVPASIGIIIILLWRRHAIVPILLGLLVFILAISVAAQTPRFARLIDITEGTNFYRIRVWQSALNLIEDYPVTGVGLDQFLYAFRDTYIMPDAWEEPELSHPHNFVLDMWTRLGIGGVLWFALLQLFFWLRCKQIYSVLWNNKQQPIILVVIIGIIGSMVNLLAHGMVDNSIFVLDLAYIFVMFIALTQNIYSIYTTSHAKS